MKQKGNIIIPLINYIIIFSFLFKLNYNYIVIPFKYKTYQTTTNMTEIIYNLLDNKLIITINIGEPQTNLELYASMNQYIYYLEEGSCLANSSSTYNNSNSKAFSSEVLGEEDYCSILLDDCSICKDKIYLYEDINLKQKIELDNFLFYLGKKKNNININNKDICGKIGFQLENKPYIIYHYYNFISFLKQNDKKISYSWYIHYYEKPFKKNVNEIYDGALVFDVFCNKFYEEFPYFKSNSDYYYVRAKDLERILAWTFPFDKIFYKINNTKIEINNKEVGLAFELDLILCPKEYFESIQKEFFEEFLNNKICFLVEGQYNYIYCDKNNFQKNIKNFPTIYFKSNELNKTFILDANDLFREYDKNILFMIVLEKYSFKFWKLGRLFMKKYNFYFDNDRKLIGCLNKVEVSKTTKSFFSKIKWYLFIIIGVIVGFIIGKKIRDKARKIRANELEDNYEYLENKANNKANINNNINTNNISNYKEIKSQLFDMNQ